MKVTNMMLNTTKNGHGAMTVPTIKGAGVGNRRATKSQRAALAAAILMGDVNFKFTVSQLALIIGVNPVYIWLAAQLPRAKRDAIATGKDKTSFSTMLKSPKAPKPVTDEVLTNIVRVAGVDRILTVAAAVDATNVKTIDSKTDGKAGGNGSFPRRGRPVGQPVVVHGPR